MNIVEKIHNEIDTAQDRLLAESLSIIKNNTTKLDKAKRLENIGFVRSETVQSSKQLQLTEDKANIIQYYKKQYPFLKFITIEELDRICDKYNLIYAQVDRYIKDVPERNIKEIENAQPLKKGDDMYNTFTYSFNFFGYVPIKVRRFFKTFKSDIRLVSDDDFRDKCPIKYEGEHLYNSGGLKTFETKMGGLFIAAPKSHFDLSELKQHKNGFFSVFKIVPKDPIVFRFVRGGVQIITKWGDEAEESSLLNPINN